MFTKAGSTPPISLLFVEDDPASRQVATTTLSLKYPDLLMHHAENGEDGLAAYRRHRPDIVLTDLQMPKMDGISMAREILADDAGAHIIVISAHSDLSYLLEGIRIGIRRYVLKPLQLELLNEAVADCICRVELQRKLRRQDAYIAMLSQAVEQGSSLIAVADPDGELVYANSKFREFTGYGSDELTAMNLRQLHFDGAAPEEFDAVWSTISSGAEWQGEGISRKKNGQRYHEAVSIAPIRDGKGAITHFVTIREDITARKRTQEEMNCAQRLESLGVLAGGLAHDFNNILTSVIGNLSLARIAVADPRRVGRYLDEAEKASQRAADLTRQLLTFARGGMPVKKQVPVEQLVDRSLSLALRGANVRGEARISETVHAVEVDDRQIIQAFNNILINAVQAMPEGGKVVIEAENVELEAANEYGLGAGSYVRISFADRGCGIPEEIRGRIFDPYVTTKPGGSGLGLTACHSIITKHGGHIGVDESAGCGATVVCHLPSTGTAYSRPHQTPESCHSRVADNGAILLMDDDVYVRKIAAKMLDCLGYEVTACADGREAIDEYRKAKEEGHPFALVIMDLTVPGGMGGKDAAQGILAFDPGARLVVSSAYCDDPVMANYRDYGFCSVLPKPYVVAELARMMRELQGQDDE